MICVCSSTLILFWVFRTKIKIKIVKFDELTSFFFEKAWNNIYCKILPFSSADYQANFVVLLRKIGQDIEKNKQFS